MEILDVISALTLHEISNLHKDVMKEQNFKFESCCVHCNRSEPPLQLHLNINRTIFSRTSLPESTQIFIAGGGRHLGQDQHQKRTLSEMSPVIPNFLSN
ncbi:hypothetical protein [Pseudomonas svalbardensis]|uniref:hypothetical protein n=1 Tax=Pseudomonas svalbardensis TaxID=3042029 RepID=UPI0024B3544D|nr:hypothetical protein [Pseudomonas sp. PMCC200367]